MKLRAKMILSGICVALLAIASTKEANRLVEQRDFEVSSLVKPKVIMGRNFWNEMMGARYNPKVKNPRNALYFPTSGLPESMRKYMDIPAFREVMILLPSLARESIRKNEDGSISMTLPDNYQEWIPKNLPFMIRTQRFVGCFPEYADIRFLLPHKADPEYYQAWRKRNQNFFAFWGLSEWGNSANMLFLHLESRYVTPYTREKKVPNGRYLTEEQVSKIAERYHRNPMTRRDYVNNRLKPYFEDAVRVTHGDASANEALDGVWNIGHLAAYWGAGYICMETSRVYVNWQYMLMFYRGAARQFNIPWGWYAASHATIYNSKGATAKGAEPYAWKRSDFGGPDCGASLNSRERVSYMAYLSGANVYMRETAEGNYWDYTAEGEERWKPAAEGQMYIDFFNFTRRNQDRGTPYAPVALLVAHDRGTCRLPGKAFWRYRYLQSDNMLDAFVTTIFLPQSSMELHRKGIEMTLLNSKYGDIFDALTPDFEKSEAFARILPAYKVAILIGEYENNPGMVNAMVDYVKGGGTLILNSKQLNLKFPADFTGIKAVREFTDGEYKSTLLKPETASVLLADNKDRPVFTRNKYGKGAVIVSAPHFLTPYYDDSNERTANAVLQETVGGKRKFPHVQWLLDRLLEEVVPANVSGDIQYGFNRTADGWWIYLFNNNGVLKTALTPQKFDPSAKTTVKIDLSKLNVLSIKELMSGETFTGNKIEVPVEPGKCRILYVKIR